MLIDLNQDFTCILKKLLLQVINNAPSYNMNQNDTTHQPINNNGKQPAVEESTTTTVQFIAVSAEEHARMVTQGELPSTVHGADVFMQIANNESQRVSIE